MTQSARPVDPAKNKHDQGAIQNCANLQPGRTLKTEAGGASGWTGETACTTTEHPQFAGLGGHAFSLPGLLPRTAKQGRSGPARLSRNGATEPVAAGRAADSGPEEGRSGPAPLPRKDAAK